MAQNLMDRIGDWNPQLVRELKGRLKPRNIGIASAVSLLGQLFMLITFQTKLPVPLPNGADVLSRYCTGEDKYYERLCILGADGSFVINWSLWWQDLFVTMTLISIFTVLIAGTYLLISDLAKEERRGTLNFIRLSPQSTTSILMGKILGVPALIYLLGFLTVPLHLWAGISAQIPISLIFGFYAVLLASCGFFFSAALLLGLFSSAFNGLQAWLGSGLMLMFLQLALYKPVERIPLDWLSLFSPSVLLPFLVQNPESGGAFSPRDMSVFNMQWFSFPLGESDIAIISAALINFGIWTYWIWQGLLRRYPNPNQTILSKGQSYGLVACFEAVALGFAVSSPSYKSYSGDFLPFNFCCLLVFNLVLFLGLIVTLSPQRQTLIDWARYRRERASDGKGIWNHSLIKDLVWGEKSPALIAIGVNLVIASAILTTWVAFWSDIAKQEAAISALLISMSLTLVYAAIAQFMEFVYKPKQTWVSGSVLGVSCATILPMLGLGILTLSPEKFADAWLFSAFPWVAIQHASLDVLFIAFLSQVTAVVLLNRQLSRQLKKAGESASKALFDSSRPSLPAS